MEQIIANLLVADNEVIKKATADLQEAYKRNETIPELCQIVVSQSAPQIRQYAAVILRRRLTKLRFWRQLSHAVKEEIKTGMLNALIAEREKIVRLAIAQLVGVLIRHESEKQDGWMDKILDFIIKTTTSPDAKQSELGASVFAVLADAAPDQHIPYMKTLCEMFNAALVATEQAGTMAQPVIYHLIVGMTYLVPVALGNQVAEHTYQNLMPLLLKALMAFAVKGDEEEFCSAFEIFEAIADYIPKLLNNNVRILIEFCLTIANNKDFDCTIRNKAVAYIGWLCRLKKKAFLKLKLLEPTLQVLFDLMSTPTDDEEQIFLGEDGCNPTNTAPQTLDILALNFPPEKFIPPLLQILEPAFQGQDPWQKRAGFVCMAVIAEGCSDAISSKYLETMVKIINIGITDTNQIVRNAAFYALGQFSEQLQPEISKYANDILPILFEFLSQLVVELDRGSVETNHIDRMFYALELFCENLEENVEPHLPNLMERLFGLMNPAYPVRVRELVMSTISAITLSAKLQMLPYLIQITSILRPYLLISENEDVINLRPHAIDCLASLARSIGKENFYPLANDTMTIALGLLENADDPDLKRALYHFFGALSIVVTHEMSKVFPQFMDRVMESVKQTEEMVPSFEDEDGDSPYIPPPVQDDIDIEESDDEDDDDDDGIGYSVENSYLDEKEMAITLLKELAENTGPAFMPYLEKSFTEVYCALDHPHSDIRKTAIETLVAFVIAYHKGEDFERGANTLGMLVSKISKIVHTDEEMYVAQAGLDGFTDLLKELNEKALPNMEIREYIFSCVNDVLLGKIASQGDEDSDEEGGAGGGDYDDSQMDGTLLEAAQNILPSFGNAMTPQEFADYFSRIYPIMLQKMRNASEDDDDAAHQRCTFYGTIAESIQPLGQYATNYFDELCSLLIKGLEDEDELARQNAAYGLGELVLACNTRSYSGYPVILNALSNAFAKETKLSTLDNMCGAVARLIINNAMLVPLPEVLPVFFQKLPLKEDFDENASIIKSFQTLLTDAPHMLQSGIVEQIIAICVHVLFKKEYTEEDVAQNAVELLRKIRETHRQHMDTVINANPEVASFLQQIL